MGGVDHLRSCRSAIRGELTEQVFPDAAPRPTHKAVIDRRWRTIGFRAIAPATATLEHMHDTADDAPVVRSLDAAHIRRQLRLDPRPLSSLSQNRFLLINLPPVRIIIVLSGPND